MVTVPARRLLWRLTRNRYARALTDALGALGVRATKVDTYVLPADRTPPERSPEGVSFEVMPASTVGRGEGPDAADLAPDDRVAFARVDDEAAGYVVASERPVPIPELDRRAVRDGAFLWGLFVHPAHRERGIATALVGRAVAAAREQFDVGEAFALVALGDYPSRRAFEANGFRVEERVTYYRAFGRERRVVSDPRP